MSVLVHLQGVINDYLAPLRTSAPAPGQCLSIVNLPFPTSAAPDSVFEEFGQDKLLPCIAVGFPDETYEAGGAESGTDFCRVNSIARFALIYFTDLQSSPDARFLEHAMFRDRLMNVLPNRFVLDSEYPPGAQFSRFALVGREYTAGPDWAATKVLFETKTFQIAGALPV